MAKLSIVQRALIQIKGGTEADMLNFYTAVKKNWEKAIKITDRNIEKLTDQYDEEIEDVTEKIKEAKADLEAVYITINPEKIKNSEDRKNYIEVFETNIATATNKVISLEERLSNLKDKKESEIKEQISNKTKYQAQLNKLEDVDITE